MKTPHHYKLPFIIASFLLSIPIVSCNRSTSSSILVAGSANLDTFLPLKRLPNPGENLTLLPNTNPIIDVPGGKGCNQAIACSKLSRNDDGVDIDNSRSMSRKKVHFISRLGDVSIDQPTLKLIHVLEENHVDIKQSIQCKGLSSGRGYVFLEKDTGKVSAVVSGGSNLYGWNDWESLVEGSYLDTMFESTQPQCLLLQREISENVNYSLAKYVNKVHNKKKSSDCQTIVLQDIGGEDRPMSSEMLSVCDYIMPNETELIRLVKTFATKEEWDEIQQMLSNHDQDDQFDHIVKLASILQENGANNVLCTLGEKGSILIMKANNEVYFQKAFRLDNKDVLDETGAGDCYRAGFAVALSEGMSIEKCMEFASASGAIAVTKEGAVPSIPSRDEVEALILRNKDVQETHTQRVNTFGIPRGGGEYTRNDESFPFMFGSRLNSMKDRPELYSNPLDDVREWVKRQSTVDGLGCVDFNWPQHFQTWSVEEAKEALDEVGLVAGAVCLRYPSKFARGAMIHPDTSLRREAIALTKKAAEVARKLGCNEVVVWSAYDGYDYPFQVNYKEKWDQIVSAFQECCDEYPDINWSLEFKPTDENTRFFTVPSTGAAMLLLKDIDRPNMGLTLDVGHMLMAGENPGQSISMVGDKLFGIQLNDGYTRLAAEDGMMFGSIHPTMALEIMYQLQENNFNGHLYFDTFPQRTDPVKECEYNIRKVKEFWNAAKRLNDKGIKEIMKQHDAIGALEILNLKFSHDG